MKVIVVLFLCVLAVLAEKKCTTPKDLSSKGVDTRIINGELAVDGQFPWQVAVTYYIGGYYYCCCGGALISRKWVLTAGHCADGVDYFYLSFGSTHIEGPIGMYAYTAHVHPDYNDWLNNDIALILLPETIQFTNSIQPINLAAAGNILGVGDNVRVSGWGKVDDSFPGVTSELRYVDLKTISNTECRAIYDQTVQNNTVCCETGSPVESTCNGDSGGPVVQYENGKAIHVATVSFIHIKGCESGYPSGYIRTEAMLDWIYSTTGLSPTV